MIQTKKSHNPLNSIQITPHLEGSENLKHLLRRSRAFSPMIPVNREIHNSYSSDGNNSFSTSNEEISDPSSDSETMSCFRGSTSPIRQYSSRIRKSELSTTKVKLLQSKPSITVVLNENIQCVIKLNGKEMDQVKRLILRYNLSSAESRKLKRLVIGARKGNQIDKLGTQTQWNK